MMAAQLQPRRPRIPAAPPPEYTPGDYGEPGTLSTPPAYDGVVAQRSWCGLVPTHVYQVEAQGHPVVALPFAPRPSPIGIFAVRADGTRGALAYQSLRHGRCSGNSVLVRADDPLAREPLCSTTYRFGPGRPPRIQLQGEAAHGEAFDVVGKGVHTRAHTMRTHLGTFRWRYASRRERRAVGASSLLVMEQVAGVALPGGKTAERRTRIAQLLRSEALRTPGTTGATAGNGGRLVMDLAEWAGRKAELRAMEVLVLSGCVVMLKKEVDRRRAAQFMVLAGAGGGP